MFGIIVTIGFLAAFAGAVIWEANEANWWCGLGFHKWRQSPLDGGWLCFRCGEPEPSTSW